MGAVYVWEEEGEVCEWEVGAVYVRDVAENEWVEEVAELCWMEEVGQEELGQGAVCGQEIEGVEHS